MLWCYNRDAPHTLQKLFGQGIEVFCNRGRMDGVVQSPSHSREDIVKLLWQFLLCPVSLPSLSVQKNRSTAQQFAFVRPSPAKYVSKSSRLLLSSTKL